MLKKLFRLRHQPTPKLSLVVVVFDMPDQAEKTLLSLSPQHQHNVKESDYEIILVENNSPRELGKHRASRHGNNIRYFRHIEPSQSPVPAAIFGVEQARGDMLGMMIDGARMASPGLVYNIIHAGRISQSTVVAVPGYHLGEKLQQESVNDGYNETEEAKLLDSIQWPEDGYKLFDVSCVSGSCRGGFFRPNAESNCLAMHRKLWRAIGGFDPRFTETGGGQANPDMYKRTCEYPGVDLVITPGEGTFHQFHGGVTTGTIKEEREQHMHNHFEQYRALRGRYYSPPEIPARLFGKIPPQATRFLIQSIKIAETHQRAQNAKPNSA